MAEQELIHIEPTAALDVFTNPEKMAPLLAIVRAEIDKFKAPDVSTEAGRKEFKSFVFKIVRSRTYLESVGKKLADEQKAIPKKIDEARRKANSTLEAWEADVRKPLTAWETAEAERVAKHKATIFAMQQMGLNLAGLSSGAIQSRIDDLEEIPVDGTCQEFRGDYALARDVTMRALKAALVEADKREADAAELMRLRRIQAERDAAEDARNEEARRAYDEENRREEESRRAAAEAKRIEDARIEAARAEAQRIADQAAAEKRAADAREADKKHRASIHRTIIAGIQDAAGITEDQAKAIITGIATRQIINIRIEY